MRPLATLAILLAPVLAAQTAERTQSPAAVISVRSALVVVPALVKTRAGGLVFTLKADDFTVRDDGAPQTLRLEEDTDSQPLALVVVVETGSDGARHLPEYHALSSLLDAIIGNVPHKIAVVSFDSEPELLQGFSSDTDRATAALDHLEPGDDGAAILDGLAFAVEMLRKQPPTYRRAILLVSETLDQGSHIELTDALHALSDANTSIYALGFSSGKAEVRHEASKFRSHDAGPPHGCFSKDPASDENRAEQDFDCLAQLLPPLRLAKMVEIATRNSLRKNVPETCAKLSGGEYFGFKDGRSLRRGMFTLSNDVPNRYVLTFRPRQPHPGLHSLTVELNSHPELTINARTEYWVDEGSVPAGPSR